MNEKEIAKAKEEVAKLTKEIEAKEAELQALKALKDEKMKPIHDLMKVELQKQAKEYGFILMEKGARGKKKAAEPAK